MLRILGVSLMAAVLGACATTDPSAMAAPSAQPAAPAAAPQVVADSGGAVGDNPMICEDEPITGSRFSHRVCMSKKDRDALAEAAREDVDSFQHGACADAACQGH